MKIDLSPETICGFYVSEKRKKVWAKELEITEKIIEICDKYKITYYFGDGSLLGAIRHQGFIPWDDDMDIYMYRKDYNKFLSIAEKELKPPFFTQYYKTEKGYYYGHAQIRNSNTTALINRDNENNFNHGIFVDIFPLDNVPDNLNERKKFIRKIRKKRKMLRYYYNKNNKNIVKKIIKTIYVSLYYKFHSLEKEIEKYEKLLTTYDNENTKECSILFSEINKYVFKNEWFEKTIIKKFEYLDVKVPEKYDECLKKLYGDYMSLPKIKGISEHSIILFDTEKSYIEYKE